MPFVKADLKLATQKEVSAMGRGDGMKGHMTIVEKLKCLCIAGENIKWCSSYERLYEVSSKC